MAVIGAVFLGAAGVEKLVPNPDNLKLRFVLRATRPLISSYVEYDGAYVSSALCGVV